MENFDVVTGGAGFIGSHLVDRLASDGRKLIVIDNFSVGRIKNIEQYQNSSNVQIIEADVANSEKMAKYCKGAERIFHLAARADIVPSIQDPEIYFRANVDGTFAMLEAARSTNIKKFVYVASSSCYGIPDVYPTPENSPPDPRYPYALTKYLGEQTALHWAQVYKLPITSVRFFNVYGPRARTNGTYGAVFGVFIAQLLAGKPLTVVGDGNQTRDFTYVTDVVEALIAVANSGVAGRIYNVGSGSPSSVNELVNLLGAKKIINIPKRPGEPDCTWADITRITDEIGWSPKISLADGVKKLMENLDYWRDAPVWSEQQIKEATADWFKYLS